MGTSESIENKDKFQFIDHNDAQQSRFEPYFQSSSLLSKKSIKSSSNHGPVNGQIGQFTGLEQFIVPEKYSKYMLENPLKCQNPQIQSHSGFNPYMFKKSLNVYHGQWKNSKPHGYGKIFNPDRDFYYEGYFQEGLPSFYGVYIADNITYRGQLKHGRAQGKGTYKDQDTIIQGIFKQNQPNKDCVQQGKQYKFLGQFENGKWKKGTLTWNIGKSSYQGEFLLGVIHGKGVMKTESFIYEGDFNNGKRHGLGKIDWNNGYCYIGNFHNDQINGYGQFFKDSKLLYKGEFENGKAKGQGCIIQNEKIIYGLWSSGQATGIS